MAQTTSPSAHRDHGSVDQPLVSAVSQILTSVGRLLMDRQARTPDLVDRAAVVRALVDNDESALAILRPALEALSPNARWAEDELGSGALAAGEWWVVDPVEGNINHIHGTADWGVTATLVQDNVAVLTVVHLPRAADTYTATLGGGAHLNGRPIAPSQKTSLDAALVGTGQAAPGETAETFAAMSRSIEAMLNAGLVLRVSVPATLALLQVADGRSDVFWQHSAVRSGLFAGALLVSEAGGVVTDLQGRPWSLDNPGFLAAAPGLHAEAVTVLSTAS